MLPLQILQRFAWELVPTGYPPRAGLGTIPARQAILAVGIKRPIEHLTLELDLAEGPNPFGPRAVHRIRATLA